MNMEITPFIILPLLVSFIIFLGTMNSERNEKTSWGDCFLKAFTKACIWCLSTCAIEFVLCCVFGIFWALTGPH